LPPVPRRTDCRAARLTRRLNSGIVEMPVATILIAGFAVAAASWSLRRKSVASRRSSN